MPKTSVGVGNLRVLVYSPPGQGKTYLWLKAVLDNPESTFHVIDIDAGVNETIAGFPKAQREQMLKRINYYLCDEWKDVMDSFEEIRKNIKPEDFIVLEGSGQIWDLSQEHYTREVFGKELGEYYVQLRQQLVEQKKKGSKVDGQARLDGWRDWGIIKRIHNNDFLEVLTKRLICKAVILTASAKELDDNPMYENAEVIDIFKPIGYKPEGEKHNIYRVDCILFLTKNKQGKRVVKSPKSRGFDYWESEIPAGQTGWDVYSKKRDERDNASGGQIPIPVKQIEKKPVPKEDDVF